jgi:hypothetical protein
MKTAVKTFICSVAFGISLPSICAEDSSPNMPMTTPNRSIYFNGIDISSARNQDLRNVHIKISETGDIFITGPQYQVTEEETFMPLSSFKGKTVMPEHRPPQAMNSTPTKTAKAPSPETSEKLPNNPAPNSPVQPASPSTPK